MNEEREDLAFRQIQTPECKQHTQFRNISKLSHFESRETSFEFYFVYSFVLINLDFIDKQVLHFCFFSGRHRLSVPHAYFVNLISYASNTGK